MNIHQTRAVRCWAHAQLLVEQGFVAECEAPTVEDYAGLSVELLALSLPFEDELTWKEERRVRQIISNGRF